MIELNRDEYSGIRSVILEQLDALSQLDGERALQRLTQVRRTGTGKHFLQSIANVFPQLAQARKAEFGDLRLLDGRYAQKVRVTAWDGTAIEAIYFLERQGDGTWLIDGCVCGNKGGAEPKPYLN